MFLVAIAPILSQSATITAELANVTKHKQLPDLASWNFYHEPVEGAIELSLNPELGEKGRIYLVPEQKEWGHYPEDTNVAWDFSVNQNVVHTVAEDILWFRIGNTENLVLDREVAQRTTSITAATVLNSDIFYRHYLTPFSKSYYDPLVYFGNVEKQKYINFIAQRNIIVQSLAKAQIDHNSQISTNIVSPDTWAPYSRHKITTDQLKSTLTDTDIAPYLVLVRGNEDERYLSPGPDKAVQDRTVTVVFDIKLSPESRLNNVVFKAPVIFTDLITLNMKCTNASAAEVLEWILSEVAEPSDQPEAEGRFIVSANILLQATTSCFGSI